MSMSDTLPSEKEPNIAEPTFALIDLEDAANHILKHTRKTSSRQDEETIKNVKKDCKEKFFKNLLAMINKLIIDQNTFGNPKGLSDKDRLKDNVNMEKIKKLRALPLTEKREFSSMFAAMARGFENSPLAKTINWWTEFLTYFKAYKSWNDLDERIRRDGRTLGKTQAEISATRDKLAQLLKDWSTHAALAHYSGQDLYEFYYEYLNVTDFENAIDTPDKNLNFTVKNFLREVSAYKNALKKQVVSSMLARMNAAIDHADLEYDDLLMDLIVNIKKHCGIDIKKDLKIPDPRRSLTPELFLAYAKTIKAYCRANPNETDIAARFAKLKVNITDYNIADDAIFSYSNCTLPGLIEQINKEKSLTSLVLNVGVDYDNTSLLYKLNLLIISLNAQHKTRITQNTSSDVIARYVKSANSAYLRALHSISENIKQKTSKDCMELCRFAFETHKLDENKLGLLIENFENARLFAVHYFKQLYYEPADIILAVSQNILNWCADGNELTLRDCQMIYQVIAAAYHDIGAEQLQKLKNNISQLVSLTKNAQQLDSNLLHHIIRVIEADIIPIRGLEISLYRHQSLAKEAWLPLPDVTADTTDELRRVHLLLCYIEKVMLISENTSSELVFANFDSNSAINTLDELRIMIEKLKLPKANILALQKQADALRHKLEEKTLDKLSKKFEIKNNIFKDKDDSTQEMQQSEIDFNKLQNLIEKTNSFFKTPEFKRAFREKTIAACTDVAANYCINLIIDSDNEQIDIDYLEKLSNILGVNIIAELGKKSSQFWKTFEASMKDYNGVNTTFSKLLVRLFPEKKSEKYNDCIRRYGQKRLDNILLNHVVTQDDYEFFNHFQDHPDIKQHIQAILPKINPAGRFETALHEEHRWDEKTAKLIELFGDTHMVLIYRQKRVMELFTLTASSSNNDDDDNDHLFYELEKFKQTINPKHQLQGALFDAKGMVTAKTNLSHFIDKNIDQKKCTIKLLDLVAYCGSKEQLHTLRTKAVKTCLDKADENLAEWLNEQMMAADNIRLAAFFGENNINTIIADITNVLTPLLELNKNIDKTVITPELLQQTENALKSILPLQTFYQEFSTNAELSAFFASTTDFMNKLKLYFSIHQTVENEKTDSKLASNNPDLRHAIFAFKAMNEKGTDIATQNIKSYLHMIEVDILSKILSCTTKKHPIPDPESLFTLTELLDHLASNKIKELLFEAITDEIAQNPYWMTLVNSLDQPNMLTFIENIAITQHEEKYRNPRFTPEKPSVIQQDNPARNVAEGQSKAVENNDPLLYIDHDSTIANPQYDNTKPTLLNPAYNKEKPLSNNNHPYVNSDFIFIQFTDSFMQTLEFAKKLCEVKARVNILIKRGMCEEAEINDDISTAKAFSKTLSDKNVNDKQLLNLWAVCFNRLKSVVEKKRYLFPLANMFVSMLVAISSALLSRAVTNKKLIDDFITKLAILPTLYMLITSSYRDRNVSRRRLPADSIWQSPAPAELLQRPLMLTSDKACALKIEQAIESYIMTKKEMKIFLEYYQKSKPSNGLDFVIDKASLKKDLKISKDSTAAKIGFAMSLHHKLICLQEGKCDFNHFQSSFKSLSETLDKKDMGGDLKKLLDDITTTIDTANSLKKATVAIGPKSSTPTTNRRLN